MRNQKAVQRTFEWIGFNAYHHSCLFIAFGIFLTIVCSLGFLRFRFLTDSIDLWVPTDGDIYDDYKIATKYFGEFETASWILLRDKNNENLVVPDTMTNLFHIFEDVYYNLSAEYSGTEWKFDDICTREYERAPYCSSWQNNIFALFDNNPDNWNTSQRIISRLNNPYYQAEIAVS